MNRRRRVGLVHIPTGRQLAAGGKQRRKFMGRAALYAKAHVEKIYAGLRKDLDVGSVHVDSGIGGGPGIRFPRNIGGGPQKRTKGTSGGSMGLFARAAQSPFTLPYTPVVKAKAVGEARDKVGRWTKEIARDALHAHLIGLMTGTKVSGKLGQRADTTRKAAAAGGKAVAGASAIAQVLSHRAMEMKPGPRAAFLRAKLQQHGVLSFDPKKVPARTRDYSQHGIAQEKKSTSSIFEGHKAEKVVGPTHADRAKRDRAASYKLHQLADNHERFAALRAQWKQPQAAAMYLESAKRLREQATRMEGLALERVKKAMKANMRRGVKVKLAKDDNDTGGERMPAGSSQYTPQANFTAPSSTPDHFTNESGPFLNPGANQMEKKASPKARAKVKRTMDEWKAGGLHSGSKTGPKVTDQKQAIAIALSQAGLSKREFDVMKARIKRAVKAKLEKDDSPSPLGMTPPNEMIANKPGEGVGATPGRFDVGRLDSGGAFTDMLNNGGGIGSHGGDPMAKARAYVEKKFFSAARRRKDAASGKAMRGGRYPIENATDLANARRDAARTNAGSAVMAHIAERAHALGVSKSRFGGEYRRAVIEAVAREKLSKSMKGGNTFGQRFRVGFKASQNAGTLAGAVGGALVGGAAGHATGLTPITSAVHTAGGAALGAVGGAGIGSIAGDIAGIPAGLATGIFGPRHFSKGYSPVPRGQMRKELQPAAVSVNQIGSSADGESNSTPATAKVGIKGADIVNDALADKLPEKGLFAAVGRGASKIAGVGAKFFA